MMIWFCLVWLVVAVVTLATGREIAGDWKWLEGNGIFVLIWPATIAFFVSVMTIVGLVWLARLPARGAIKLFGKKPDASR